VAQDRVNKFVDSLRGRQASPPTVLDAQARPRQAESREPAARVQASALAFDPQVLAKLGHLELIAKSVVDGFLSGKHRSTHKGGCTDFAEFRPYAKGDDIRLLDWRHYAKSDRYYVKRYDDETNLQAVVIVDASGSMSFGLSTVSKWQYAQFAAASLAHLLLRQRDSVGLALVESGSLDFVKPQPRSNHLARLLQMIGAAKPAGASNLPAMLREMMARLKRRGMVILLSDCFGNVEELKQVLQQYVYHGHDVLVCQILAPEELTFPFRRDAIFQDLELHQRLHINPNTLRKAYLVEFQAFMNQLRSAMTDIGVDLMTFSTSDDLGEVLAYHLRRRAAMKNVGRSTAGV
jgi:uncharacterized protein (DUF58 family)